MMREPKTLGPGKSGFGKAAGKAMDKTVSRIYEGSKDWHMSKSAKLELDGKLYEFPTVTGIEGERAIDISALRDTTGYITLDPGYANTGSCTSAITFIDGEKGILRYRGIDRKSVV